MTTHSRPGIRQYLAVDGHGLAIATLLAGVALAAALLAPELVGSGVEQAGEIGERSAGEQAAAGGLFSVYVVLVAALAVGLILLAKRLPVWVREMIADGAYYTLLILLGGIAAVGVPHYFIYVLAGYFALYVALETIENVGLWWVMNNVLVVALAVVLAAFLGVVLGPYFVLVALLGLTVYDHWFANKRAYMFELASVQVRRKVPVLFVWPARWRFAWEDLAMDKDADRSGIIAWGLGLGDLLLAGMFVAALAVHWSGPAVGGLPLAAWGALVGLAVAGLRLRFEMTTAGSGAGMPAIAAGAIGGFVVFAAIGVIVG